MNSSRKKISTTSFSCSLGCRYFQEVLAQAENCNKVSLLKDGSWTPMFECDLQADTKEHQGTTEKRTFEEITVTDSDEESPHIEIGRNFFSLTVQHAFLYSEIR